MLAGCFFNKSDLKLREPEFHYDEGLKLLKQMDWEKAAFEFKYCLELNNNFAPAHLGLAILNLRLENISAAEFHINKALWLNSEWAEAKLVKGKILHNKGEYSNALRYLQSADTLIVQGRSQNGDLLSPEINLWSGLCLQNLGRMEEAKIYLGRVLKKDHRNKKAKEALQEVNQYLTWTRNKSVPFKQIALKKVISRADWSLLVASDLIPELRSIDTHFSQPEGTKPQALTDFGQLRDLPAESIYREAIIRSLESKIMFVFPDNTFKPERSLCRAEIVIIFKNIWNLYLQNPANLEAKNRLIQSPFKDISPFHPIFESVLLARKFELIKGFEDGTFRLEGTVSGLEALALLSRIKKLISTKQSSE